jgi:hypothetical protein
LGADDLWITEYLLTYDGQPSYVVSIMEFRGGQVSHETQYFGDAFEPGPSRAQWVEPISALPQTDIAEYRLHVRKVLPKGDIV